jgi:hypothetical protein
MIMMMVIIIIIIIITTTTTIIIDILKVGHGERVHSQRDSSRRVGAR